MSEEIYACNICGGPIIFRHGNQRQPYHLGTGWGCQGVKAIGYGGSNTPIKIPRTTDSATFEKETKRGKKLLQTFYAPKEDAAAAPGPLLEFTDEQLEAGRADVVDDLFAEIKKQRGTRGYTLVNTIIRSKRWTYLIHELQRKEIFKQLNKGEMPLIKFSVYHPRQLIKNQKSIMIAYVYFPKLFKKIDADAQKRMGGQLPDPNLIQKERREIDLDPKGLPVITVVPKLQGCSFKPAMNSFVWKGGKERVDFQVEITTKHPKFKFDRPRYGSVRFYMNSVAIAQVDIWAFLEKETEKDTPKDSPTHMSANPFQKIFVSYAHEDVKIVELVESVGKTLGNVYLRDVNIRSGEDWPKIIRKMIDEANIFQLFWSPAAADSKHIESEWKHALNEPNIKKPCFIRPVYWEKPLKAYAPPKELEHIQFAFLEIKYP